MKIMITFIFFAVFSVVQGAAFFDVGKECYEEELTSLKVLANSKIKGTENCFLSLSCMPKVHAVPFHFSCDKDPFVFSNVINDFNKFKSNSFAIVHKSLYLTLFDKEKASSSLVRIKSGTKESETILKFDDAYMYLSHEGNEIRLYKWKLTSCSGGTVSRKFWKGCFRSKPVTSVKIE